MAMSFREALSKINELRNKATALELPSNPDPATVQKYIAVLEMYTRFALLIAKHFNWNPDYGQTVQDLSITWMDSFNPDMHFMKN